MVTAEGAWAGGELGPVRPYALVRGRTRPTRDLTRDTLMLAATDPPTKPLLGYYPQVYAICSEGARSVAEIAARLDTTLQVATIWLSDLMDLGYVVVPTPDAILATPAVNRALLTAVLEGLKRKIAPPTRTEGT